MGTLLLVEDDRDMRETLADLLDGLGYGVVCAGRGGSSRLPPERAPAGAHRARSDDAGDGWVGLPGRAAAGSPRG